MGARRSSSPKTPISTRLNGTDAGHQTVLERFRFRAISKHPMGLGIRVEAANRPASVELIRQSQAELLEHLPPDEIFSLDADELCAPNVTFFVARIDNVPVGCVALLDCTNYGEIKRLFVRSEHRGKGIARALMQELEQYCRDIGLADIRLETSSLLVAAVKLYRDLGYDDCAAFGDYPVVDSSLFLSRSLAQSLGEASIGGL